MTKLAKSEPPPTGLAPRCLLNDPAKCRLECALEVAGGRGIVQVNCQACGAGASATLPIAAAMKLHDELHRHKPPIGDKSNVEGQKSHNN